MNSKKFTITLAFIIGVAIVLVFAFASILILQKNLDIARVQASPGLPCDVTGDLNVGGTIYTDMIQGKTSGFDLTLMPYDSSRTVQVGYGGTPRDLSVWGNLNVYTNPCTSQISVEVSDPNIAVVTATCSAGEFRTGGGCECSEDGNLNEAAIRTSRPDPFSEGWECVCQRVSGSGTIKGKAYVICCF